MTFEPVLPVWVLLGVTAAIVIARVMGGADHSKDEVIEMLTIMNALFPEELQNSRLLKSKITEEEIAQVAKVEPEKVHKLVRAFDSFATMQRWIYGLHKRGEPLPADMKEMNYRSRQEAKPSRELKLEYKEIKIRMQEEERKKQVRERIDEKRMLKKIRNRPYIC